MRYLLLLLLAGCQPSEERLIYLNDTEKGTQYLRDPAPIQWEIADEYGIRKGWKF